MIKTTYQTPEIRNSNDEIVQEGAFGKNTALSNSTNDGWIDYVVNNLEALHDTIGDSAPTLDGNGHVVEPANLAIGDEDGLRIKNNYLKLSGGNVTGVTSFRTDLRMLDNQDNRFGGLYVPASSATEQYLQLYGGTRATGDARLTLYPSGDGHFSLLAYSNNGGNSYELRSDNNGNLNWRGYPLAWKKDYLPLAGGTMTGTILVNGAGYSALRNTRTDGRVTIGGGTAYNTGAFLWMFGKDYGDSDDDHGSFLLDANNGTSYTRLRGTYNGKLTWGGNAIALAKDYLPLVGGTMTGNITFNVSSGRILKSDDSGSNELFGGSNWNKGAGLTVYGKDSSTNGGGFNLFAHDGTNQKNLQGRPDGTLTWDGNQLGLQKNTNNYIQFSNGQSYTFTFTSNIVTIIARRGSNYGMYCVDVWDTGAVTMVSGGTSPLSIAHEANSHEVTITNVTGSAVVVQIIRSDVSW